MTDPGDIHLCDLHGINRRDCVVCLRQWVDDLLETQTWHLKARRTLMADNARLRRLLAAHGVEEPPPKTTLDHNRRDPGPPKGDGDGD